MSLNKKQLVEINQARQSRQAIIQATDIGSGETHVVPAGDQPQGDELLAAECAVRFKSGSSGLVTLPDGRKFFLNVYAPLPRLFIIGAVHIAKALAPMASAAGLDVTVIDPREAFATPQRFAGVRLLNNWPEEILPDIGLDEHTALAALSHDPKIDDIPLASALRHGCFYVGALGSRKTHERRLKRLKENGLFDNCLSRIHAPIGLNIGAVSPEEIAVAILAEIILALRGPKQTRQVAPDIEEKQSQIAAIILAAGQSRRMGKSNKLLSQLDGKSFIQHVTGAAIAAELAQVVVVTGHEASLIQSELTGLPVTFAHNNQFEDGLASSLRTGINAVGNHIDAVLVLLADMPLITAKTLRAIAGEFQLEHKDRIIVPYHQNQRGNPVLWPRHYFDDLAALTGDLGGRLLLQKHSGVIQKIELGTEVLIDVDSPENAAAISASVT